jgi:hypothetical protein
MTGAIVRNAEPAQQAGLKAREPRRPVFVRARMRASGALSDVCIRNISSRGMLLQAAVPPACGSYVEIFCPRHTIVARVVWTQDRRFGVRTSETMDISAVLGEGTSAAAPSANRTSRIAARLAKPEGQSAADLKERFERSRRLSAAFEFGSLVACSAGLAVVAAVSLYEYLSATFQNVTTHLP